MGPKAHSQLSVPSCRAALRIRPAPLVRRCRLGSLQDLASRPLPPLRASRSEKGPSNRALSYPDTLYMPGSATYNPQPWRIPLFPERDACQGSRILRGRLGDSKRNAAESRWAWRPGAMLGQPLMPAVHADDSDSDRGLHPSRLLHIRSRDIRLPSHAFLHARLRGTEPLRGSCHVRLDASGSDARVPRDDCHRAWRERCDLQQVTCSALVFQLEREPLDSSTWEKTSDGDQHRDRRPCSTWTACHSPYGRGAQPPSMSRFICHTL
jgi:hypothetical protein